MTLCFLKALKSLFGWVITMVSVSFGTCCHDYHDNTIDLSLSMCRFCNELSCLIMEIFDASRISTAETDTEKAAYCSNDIISSHLYTILLSMNTPHSAVWEVVISRHNGSPIEAPSKFPRYHSAVMFEGLIGLPWCWETPASRTAYAWI